MSETRSVKVLIVEDTPKMLANLSDAFERFNRKDIPLPDDVGDVSSYLFEIAKASSYEELNEMLKNRDWNVYVIDRSFGGNDQKIPENFIETALLLPLRDLQLSGLRIVWTAYPDGGNLIECMRLDAWDYLDKNKPQYVSTYIDVVVSALKGLQEKDALIRKGILDRDGHTFVIEHYGEIYAKHKGNFVAFERGQDNKWKLEAVAAAPNLFDLYQKLGTKRPLCHITWVQE
ncbi:MAG TPA: hypothetical protein PLI09_01715 [Candidatus Hydrogenedentes bacterium]|nr:hypothetical protein [Candidatus Hydrogenedentota bacterium]